MLAAKRVDDVEERRLISCSIDSTIHGALGSFYNEGPVKPGTMLKDSFAYPKVSDP